MILGSHNSWSFRTPKKWWMKLTAFTTKCQNKNIMEQYEKYSVRCFDLRIRYIKGVAHVVHNSCDYGEFWGDVSRDVNWLNEKGDVVIRVIHDVRTKKQYANDSINHFIDDCVKLQEQFPNIKFWCGENLYNHQKDFKFEYQPTAIEKYSSVCAPKLIDDWIPYIYAKLKNDNIYKDYQLDDDYNTILMLDFVASK